MITFMGWTFLAVINAGFLIHSFLPRLWRLAFGEPTVPRGIGDRSDWHQYVRSKISRSAYWLSLEDTPLGTIIFCAVCAPADHLLAVLQRFDAHGGGLRDMVGPGGSNPVDACLLSYFRKATFEGGGRICHDSRIPSHDVMGSLNIQKAFHSFARLLVVNAGSIRTCQCFFRCLGEMIFN